MGSSIPAPASSSTSTTTSEEASTTSPSTKKFSAKYRRDATQNNKLKYVSINGTKEESSLCKI
jgi:hypothetical protein